MPKPSFALTVLVFSVILVCACFFVPLCSAASSLTVEVRTSSRMAQLVCYGSLSGLSLNQE